MKTKILSVIVTSFLMLTVLLWITVVAPVGMVALASEFSGPREVKQNFRQAKTDTSLLCWYDDQNREWLRIQGNEKAATVTSQWGPQSVSIETTREPQVAKTLSGWIIVFK